MIASDIVGNIVTTILLAIFALKSSTALWILTAPMGFFISLMFPAGMIVVLSLVVKTSTLLQNAQFSTPKSLTAIIPKIQLQETLTLTASFFRDVASFPLRTVQQSSLNQSSLNLHLKLPLFSVPFLGMSWSNLHLEMTSVGTMVLLMGAATGGMIYQYFPGYLFTK